MFEYEDRYRHLLQMQNTILFLIMGFTKLIIMIFVGSANYGN